MRVIIEKDYEKLSKWAADHVVETINRFQPTAERFRKTNILREYINAFENHAIEDGETDDELLAKIQWAREKADNRHCRSFPLLKTYRELSAYPLSVILNSALPSELPKI